MTRKIIAKSLGIARLLPKPERRPSCLGPTSLSAALAAAANIYAASNDFTQPEWLLLNMRKLKVPESFLPILGTLKAAGARGLLIGFRMPLIGIAAAGELTL